MSIPEIGQEMKNFRKEHGYSQENLGKMLGLSAQSISNYENGTATPNMSVLIRFAAISGMPIPEILFIEKYKHNYKPIESPTLYNELVEELGTIPCDIFFNLSEENRSEIIQKKIDDVMEKRKNSPFFTSGRK